MRFALPGHAAPVLDGLDLDDRARRVGRARRRHRLGQVDRRPRCSPASTTSTPAPSASTASTCATLAPQRAPARASASCSRRRSSSPTPSPPTSPSPIPRPPVEPIERAARLAGAHDFVDDAARRATRTVVGERGFSLSGGQRQRIAIARAILADPRVLVLDDATSAVDPTKEHEIRDALAEVMRGRTTLVIAHRPATIALADRVVLLDERPGRGRGHPRRAARDERALPRGARQPPPRPTPAPHEPSVEASPRRWPPDVVDGRASRRRTGSTGPRPSTSCAGPAGCCGRTAGSCGAAVGAHRRLHVVRPRRAVPRPLRHRPRHLRRRRRRPQPRRRRLRSSSPLVAFVVPARPGRCWSGASARGSSATSAVRAFDHLQRLSLGWHDDQKAGVVVSRLTSDIDSLAELVQMGLLMFVAEHAAARRRRSSCSAWCRGSCCSSPSSPCRSSIARVGEVPARLEPGLPRSSATASAPRCRRSRRGWPACGSSRPTAASSARSPSSSAPAASSTTPTWTRCGSRRGTCR